MLKTSVFFVLRFARRRHSRLPGGDQPHEQVGGRRTAEHLCAGSWGLSTSAKLQRGGNVCAYIVGIISYSGLCVCRACVRAYVCVISNRFDTWSPFVQKRLLRTGNLVLRAKSACNTYFPLQNFEDGPCSESAWVHLQRKSSWVPISSAPTIGSAYESRNVVVLLFHWLAPARAAPACWNW